MDKKKTGLIVGVIALIAVIAAFIVIYNINKPKPSPAPATETEAVAEQPAESEAPAATEEGGSKNIVIEVKDSEGNVTTYEVSTDAEYLRQAMDETDGLTYSGTDSEYGMMVEVVNGEQAIYAEDNAYWAFYVNGEYGQYGIDSQPVNDGDKFSIVYEGAAATDAEGSKNITIEVKDSEGNVTTYEVSTDAEYLREAMDETEGLTYSGSESEFGMMVEVINDEKAVYAEDNAYWAIYVDGEYGMYGIDSQPVDDGSTYTFTYELAG
jgi:hypothetical protein